MEYTFLERSTDSASFLSAARRLHETRDNTFDITFKPPFRSKIPRPINAKKPRSKSKIPRPVRRSTPQGKADYNEIGRLLGPEAERFLAELKTVKIKNLTAKAEKKIRTRKISISFTTK